MADVLEDIVERAVDLSKTDAFSLGFTLNEMEEKLIRLGATNALVVVAEMSRGT